MSTDHDDWGEEYEKTITVDGETYIEVGVQDPGNEGYHTIRVPFDEEAGPGSVKEEINSAKDRLESHLEEVK